VVMQNSKTCHWNDDLDKPTFSDSFADIFWMTTLHPGVDLSNILQVQ
jgi:hypothetical protein